MNKNAQLFNSAQAVIPGGVNSPVRAYGSVGGTPCFIQRGKGAYVWDAEGKQYVDLVCSWGPMLLGHAADPVVEAVSKTAEKGLSFGAPTEAETQLAEIVRQRVPLAQKVRFVSTGTEATMTAIRLARGATGRDLIVKFAGCYHGHSDGLLSEAGSGVATGAMPASAGVPADVAGLTLVLPYNDIEALQQVFTQRGSQIGAVIVEGAAANMGVVAPRAEFLVKLADLCHTHGALLIQDEVLTGFRVSPSGWWGLHTGREKLRNPNGQNNDVQFGMDWTPDLLTFGKVVGGGMPLAALAGRADLMEQLAPLGPVYQAGTLSGNPLSTAAGVATLNAANDTVYQRCDLVADTVADALSEALSSQGVAHTIGRAGSLFSVFFASKPVKNYAEAKIQETWRYTAMFWEFHRQGVMLPPSVFESWFVSAAHDDTAVSRILDAIPSAAKAAANAVQPVS